MISKIKSGGGGPKTLAESLVEDGAVTIVSTDTIVCENHRLYNFQGVVEATGSVTTVNFEVNGDPDPANYVRNWFATPGPTGGRQAYPAAAACSSGDKLHFRGTLYCDGSTIFYSLASHNIVDTGNGLVRDEVQYAASSINEFQISSNQPFGLNNGTRLIVTEAY